MQMKKYHAKCVKSVPVSSSSRISHFVFSLIYSSPSLFHISLGKPQPHTTLRSTTHSITHQINPPPKYPFSIVRENSEPATAGPKALTTDTATCAIPFVAPIVCLLGAEATT